MENRKVSDIVSGVIVFFILLFVYTKFAGPIPLTVNNINTLNLTPLEVSGTGKAAAAPDKAIVNLGVTQTGQSVVETQKKTNSVANKIIDSLKNLGIQEKNIKTTNYSINPNYNFSETAQKITGYNVSQNFEVEVPIEKTNEALDLATSNGANLLGNISFKLGDKKEQELKNKARKEAVDRAKSSAEGLAGASGIKLGKIINIRESIGGETPRLMMAGKAQGGESKTETSITPGETNVEITVTLTYQTN